MKNLKRVLSLGLASVMLLGMMVVGASAKDFTDAEDIVHTEAVQTMVALKIINGKEDGSFFDPKGNVTRAEMAKMIAVLMNGGSEANTGVKTTPSFTDIGGHWAEGWIEYCADMNIINGRGDGTFDPNGQVTGVEALKMVLTALGYNAEAYNLVGASWAAQTMERARDTKPVKLIEELADVTLTAPATRDVAAQMIWNGLQANAVTTTPEQNKSNGEITWSYGTTGATLLKQRYDADIVKGTYAGNHDFNDNGAAKGEIVVFDGTKNHKVPSDLTIDNLGEEIKIVYRDSTTKGTKGEADAKDTIYGVFNTGATRVVRSQLSKINDNKSGDNVLSVDGTKYAAKANVDVIFNFTASASTTGSNALAAKGTYNSGTKEWSQAPLTARLKQNSGDKIKVVFDDDNKVSAVYVTESYIGVVTSKNATNIAINGPKACNLTIANHDVEEGLERGDIVVVTPLYALTNIADDAVVTVKKAEKVTGELVSGKAQETLTLDSGKSYKIIYKNGDKAPYNTTEYKLLSTAVNIPGEDGTIVDSFPFSNNAEIGETYDLYLVNGYVAAAIQTSESASNYSVIIEVKDGTAGATFGGLQLQVLTADGTKEIITVSKDSTDVTVTDPKVINQNDYAVGDIITYTFNKDDEAKVNVVAQVGAATGKTYNDKAKTVDGVATAADCVFFAQTKGSLPALETDRTDADSNKNTAASWKAYRLRELDGTTFNVVASYVKDGKVVAMVVNDGKTPKGATDNTIYAILSSFDRKEEDFWVFTASANGETWTIKSEDSSLKKGMLVKFDPTANDEYDVGDVEELNVATLDTGDTYHISYVKEFNARDNTLTLWDNALGAPTYDSASETYSFAKNAATKTYAIDKDAQIIYVDQNGDKSEAESSINAFNPMSNKQNAAYVLDDENVIKVLFVETSGKKVVDAE